MAIVQGIGTNQISAEPSQWVYVNGRLRSDIVCDAVTHLSGGRGATAQFSFPTSFYEDNQEHLRDAEVVVYIASLSRDPVFRGFFSQYGAEVAGGVSRQKAVARSPLHLMANLYVGQNTLTPVFLFPKYLRGTATRTNYTLGSIARGLFDFRVLDANWRTKIGLGIIDGLERGNVRYPGQGIVWSTMSYRAAMIALCQYAGACGLRERFTSDKTLFDFYRIGNGRYTRKVLGPTATRGPDEGAFIMSVKERRDSNNVISRVIGYSAPYKTQITVRTADGVETAPLEPDWTGASDYTDIDYSSSTATVAEQAILDFPDLAKPGNAYYDAELGKTFRVFRLPKLVREAEIFNRNLIKIDGDRYARIQVFTSQYDEYVDTGSGVFQGRSGGTLGARSTTNFEVEKGWRIDENGYLELNGPAVKPYQLDATASGKNSITYRRQHVYVTLTIYRTDSRVYFDSGILGDLQYPQISNSGIVLSFTNNSCEYQRLGTLASGLTDSDGNTHTFGTTYLDVASNTWATVSSGASDETAVVRDDRDFLVTLGNNVLAERIKRRTDAQISFPAMVRWRIGDNVRINDDRLNGKQLYVGSITWRLHGSEYGTYVALTDGVPKIWEPASERSEGQYAPPQPTLLGQNIDSVLNEERLLAGPPSPPSPLDPARGPDVPERPYEPGFDGVMGPPEPPVVGPPEPPVVGPDAPEGGSPGYRTGVPSVYSGSAAAEGRMGPFPQAPIEQRREERDTAMGLPRLPLPAAPPPTFAETPRGRMRDKMMARSTGKFYNRRYGR